VARLSALDWAWGLKTGEQEYTSTVMFGKVTVTVEETEPWCE